VTEPTPYERFKWTLLGEGPHLHTSGIAYYWAKQVWPDQSVSEADVVVQQALLELLDEGLIFFYWGGWDDGCDLDPARARHANRAEAEEELGRGGNALPKPETVWFTTTAEGVERLDSLPPTVFPTYEQHQEIERVRREHPEYSAQQAQHFRDLERWVETGEGPVPEAPDRPG
jgi:hypothetical protein